jgi:putative ABC transport system permease protein
MPRLKRLSIFCISLENVQRRRYRSLCLAGVAALLSFVVSAGSILGISLINGARSAAARLGADALLVPAGYEQELEGALLRGEPSSFYLDRDLAQRLLAAGGIEQASPQIFIASFDSPHCSAEIQMIGYDPETDFVISPWLSQTLPGGLGTGEVCIGSSILGKTGDTLLFFNRGYRVAGRLEKTGTGFDTSVFVNLDTAYTALADYASLGGGTAPAGDGAVSSIAVRIKSGVNHDTFSRNIRYDFRSENVGVILTRAMLSAISGSLKAFLGIIALLTAFLWVLAVGVLSLMFSASLNERRREFGIYRVLGAARRRLASIVLCESALVSLSGALAGTALSCLVYFSFSPLIDSTVAMPYLQPGRGTTALLLAGGFLVSSAAGPLASLRSALRIGRLATAAIMRDGE